MNNILIIIKIKYIYYKINFFYKQFKINKILKQILYKWNKEKKKEEKIK